MFEKLPAVKGSVICLTCGAGPKSDLGMDTIIGVGFGDAGYKKDGHLIWSEGNNRPQKEEDYHTAQMVEDLAKMAPDCDWRIYFYAPLYEAEYQRQDEGVWVLVSKGMGFA